MADVKKRSPSHEAGSDDYEMPKTMKGLKDEVRRLLKENQELREQLEKYKSKLGNCETRSQF